MFARIRRMSGLRRRERARTMRPSRAHRNTALTDPVAAQGRPFAGLWLFIAIGLNLLVGPAWLPLFDLDEGAFAEATREMLASGVYAGTWLDGEPRYDKPVLSYWLQAISVHLLGPEPYAFRLPSVLAAAAWLWVLHGFAARTLDRRTAAIAVLLLGQCAVFTIIAKAATADALLNLWLTLALTEIWRILAAERIDSWTLLRLQLWFGLGFLTKGPVAVIVPVLIAGAWVLSTNRLPLLLRAAFDPRGWAVFLALVVPWHLWIWQVQGWAFFEGFYGLHNIGRFSRTFESHGGTATYYLLVVPLVLLPWTGLLIGVARAGPQLWRDRQQRFELLWFACPTLLFSFSATQLPHYALYGLPGLVLLLARHHHRTPAWLLILPACATLALLASIPTLLTFFLDALHDPWDRGIAQAAIDSHALPLTVIALTGLVASALAAARLTGPTRLLALGLAFTAVVNLGALPFIAAGQQMPLLRAAAAAGDEPVVRYGMQMPSFSVARGQPTLAGLPPPGGLLVTRVDRLAGLASELPQAEWQTIHAEGGIRLLRRIR